jgi:hypothetical protein
MKCSTLFENIKKYWPNELIVDETNPDQLNQLYWSVEAKIDHEKEHWLSVSAWAFHQAIDAFIESEIGSGKSVIQMSNMPMHLFNKQILFNLEDDDWKKERSEYEQS